MNDQHSSDNVYSLLLHHELRTRELSRKKKELNQQIKVCRDDIAERKDYIESLQKDIKKFEGDITEKQSRLTKNKAGVKSAKATNSLLLQYKQTLKKELENRQAFYNHDLVTHEERIAEYKKKYQQHKDFHYNSPLAQKLLAMQAENEEIESRIKACDDQITMKQKELYILTGPAATSSPEKPSESVSGLQPETEPETQVAPQVEEDSDSPIDISSLHLNQTTDGQNMGVDANAEETFEENKVQYTTTGEPEQIWPDLMHSEEENQETKLEDQDPQSALSDIEAMEEEEEVEECVADEKEQAPTEEDMDRPTAFPQLSSQETNLQSSPATLKAAPSTPTFPFNFSPARSPRQGTSKSPAFVFSMNPDPSTPGFSEFGFDVGSSQDEDSSFAFTSPFFNEKKTTESKSSSCTEFPFGQPEQSQDFEFAFTAKSPQTTKKDNSADDFPFSFNF
ncbi:protein SIX6OS1 isoform X2 [Notolabrus celidotus]|uniref:protein SIX6OS1 isoform X2 n=1 Tax=Notolabrus celidotus TaxID=1203425 RepID=UPI001490821D|nr:protein SIX6OS1 isoform X2 [Notolabrus celidotus]